MKNTKFGLGLVVGAMAFLAMGAGTARAQALRPNILVIFDTSGSMLNNNSDGSPLCSATTGGTSSRIYSLKQALRESMAQVGTDEANFGLMRYPELEVQTQTPVCPQGHYNNNDTTGIINTGNTNPGNCTAGAACGNNC